MDKQPIITFTTDFGDDFALAQLFAIVLQINPQAIPLTISNQIAKFSILEGAFVLAAGAPFFPPGTIHVGVVDPGVGSKRESVVVQTSNYYFIGPNNGLFYPAVTNHIQQVYRINMAAVTDNYSNTFHGRDVFVRLAALLSTGKKVQKYADSIPSSQLQSFRIRKNQIVHIDNFGNIKINNDCRNFSVGDKLILQINDFSQAVPFVKTFADVPPGTLLAYQGSHNILEIAKNLGSAQSEIQAAIGEIASIRLK